MSDRVSRLCSVASALAAVSLGLAALWLLLASAAAAGEVDRQWRMVDESGQPLAVAERQARASIYRGNHLLALRCHSDGARRWTSLVFSATWFVRPKEHPRFSLAVDEGEAVELDFERETDYRFVALDPPRPLLDALAAGREVTVAGPDYEGRPVALPLDGSRSAIDRAFELCGIQPPAAPSQ